MSTQPWYEENNRTYCTVNIFRADPADILANIHAFRIGPKIMVEDNEPIFMHDNHIDDNVHGLRKTISVIKTN
jgi:hypothetical protein